MDTFGWRGGGRGGGVWDWKKKEKGDLSEKPYLYCLVCYNKHWFFYLKKNSNKIIKSYRHEQIFLLPEEISLNEEWEDLITP